MNVDFGAGTLVLSGMEGIVFDVSALRRDHRDSITQLSNTAVHSRVALEAALDEVGSVLATRVRLRGWDGIGGRFEWVKLDPGGNIELMVRRRPRWLAIPGGRAHIYNGWEGTARRHIHILIKETTRTKVHIFKLHMNICAAYPSGMAC